MSYQNRRYRVTDRRGDRYIFEKVFDGRNDPEWFVEKAGAIRAWELKQATAPKAKDPNEISQQEEGEPAARPVKRRGRPPKAEVQTGVVDA